MLFSLIRNWTFKWIRFATHCKCFSWADPKVIIQYYWVAWPYLKFCRTAKSRTGRLVTETNANQWRLLDQWDKCLRKSFVVHRRYRLEKVLLCKGRNNCLQCFDVSNDRALTTVAIFIIHRQTCCLVGYEQPDINVKKKTLPKSAFNNMVCGACKRHPLSVEDDNNNSVTMNLYYVV